MEEKVTGHTISILAKHKLEISDFNSHPVIKDEWENFSTWLGWEERIEKKKIKQSGPDKGRRRSGYSADQCSCCSVPVESRYYLLRQLPRESDRTPVGLGEEDRRGYTARLYLFPRSSCLIGSLVVSAAVRLADRDGKLTGFDIQQTMISRSPKVRVLDLVASLGSG